MELNRQRARAIKDAKRLDLDVSARSQLSIGDAVIGITYTKAEKCWAVSMTAVVAALPRKLGYVRLKYARVWDRGRSWELPLGVPSSPAFSVDGYEHLAGEAQVYACLVGAPAIRKVFSKFRAPKRNNFTPPAGALDGMVVTFEQGEPRVWSIDAFRADIVGDMASYETVIQRFLSELPAPAAKGSVFEQIVGELFRLPEFGFDLVQGTSFSRDKGIDLILGHRAPVVGNQTYLVQVKNQAKPVDEATIRAFRSICGENEAAKGIFVAPGGFAPSALTAAGNGCPQLELIDLDDLVHLLCPRLDSMPITRSHLQEWRKARQLMLQGVLFEG